MIATETTRRTSRTEQAERVKTSIIEAAIPLFARGFESVSIQQIAAAAGIKHSLVMYHFGSKDQLWEATATRLMQQFDQLQQGYAAGQPNAKTDEDRLVNQLTAFIQALRDLPYYGQMLLSEGSQQTDRLLWLHRHFFPSVVQQPGVLQDKTLGALLLQTTLLRNAVAGAMLFSVVAGPQLARSAELEGSRVSSELYPMGDAIARQLAIMLAGFILAQLAPRQPARGKHHGQ